MSVYINMFGKTVEMNGFKSEMVTKNVNNLQNKYAICITNTYGKTCGEISYNESMLKFIIFLAGKIYSTG